MRNFTEVLGDLESGRVFHDLNEALGLVVEGVKKHRKVGEITLKIKLKPNGSTAVSVFVDVTHKVPKAERATTIMFIDEDGSLRREDPRQVRMELREVEDNSAQDLKEVETPQVTKEELVTA